MYVIGAILALAAGVYIGLGFPGLPGREDRVLPTGMSRRRKDRFTPLDLLRRQDRSSERRLEERRKRESPRDRR